MENKIKSSKNGQKGKEAEISFDDIRDKLVKEMLKTGMVVRDGNKHVGHKEIAGTKSNGDVFLIANRGGFRRYAKVTLKITLNRFICFFLSGWYDKARLVALVQPVRGHALALWQKIAGRKCI